MGYSLQDFCRDAAAILKTGSTRRHVDPVRTHSRGPAASRSAQ